MHAVEAHRTQGILLCRVHADVVTVPMGWNLVDERDPTWEPVGVSVNPTPEPEPAAAVQALPDPPLDAAEVVEIVTISAEADDAEPVDPAAAAVADEAADDVADEVAFEEVVAAQWTESQESDDEVGTPTLFAVDDEAEESSAVDTPLLNRAFRAAQRF